MWPFLLQVRETRRGRKALGHNEAERQHDLREVQQGHEVSLQTVGTRLRTDGPSSVPIRSQGARLQDGQPQLRQGQIRIRRPRHDTALVRKHGL